MNNHETFLHAITNKKVIELTFHSKKDKGMVTRKCIPFDFGPSRRNLKTNPNRYHLYALNSPEGEHQFSILPEQLIKVNLLDETFDPADYITWPPNWFIQRDWDIYS